jgi:hypothetical protein
MYYLSKRSEALLDPDWRSLNADPTGMKSRKTGGKEVGYLVSPAAGDTTHENVGGQTTPGRHLVQPRFCTHNPAFNTANFLASLKSLEKGVGSGYGSFSQRYGSGDPDLQQIVTDHQHCFKHKVPWNVEYSHLTHWSFRKPASTASDPGARSSGPLPCPLSSDSRGSPPCLP